MSSRCTAMAWLFAACWAGGAHAAVRHVAAAATGVNTGADWPNASSYVIRDYHLQSEVGRKSPLGWTTDAQQRPCIDAGDPVSPVGSEPLPNGFRVNLDVHGGTREASPSSTSGSKGMPSISAPLFDHSRGNVRTLWIHRDGLPGR